MLWYVFPPTRFTSVRMCVRHPNTLRKLTWLCELLRSQGAIFCSVVPVYRLQSASTVDLINSVQIATQGKQINTKPLQYTFSVAPSLPPTHRHTQTHTHPPCFYISQLFFFNNGLKTISPKSEPSYYVWVVNSTWFLGQKYLRAPIPKCRQFRVRRIECRRSRRKSGCCHCAHWKKTERQKRVGTSQSEM